MGHEIDGELGGGAQLRVPKFARSLDPRVGGDGRGSRIEDARIGPGRIEETDGRIEEARSEEHTSELQSLMRISYAVFCLKKISKQEYISDIASSQQITRI